jgi:type II secretory pathway component PulM
VNAVANAISGERLKAWYAGLEAREQALLLWGAIAAAVLLVLGTLLQSHAVVNRAEQRLATKRADLAHIQSVLPELQAAPVPQGAGESLVIIVDRTTRDSGLAMALRGTEPAGQTGVRVRFEGASFDSTVAWLLRLQREYGVAVQAASFERGGAAGLVNASVTLARP